MDVKFVMFKTAGQQKAVSITKPVTVLGRGMDCDFRIPIESCSRRQCELRLQDDELHLKDLGSSNGTYVNNVRVRETVLHAGDKLTIGPITMTVQIDGDPADITIKDSSSIIANLKGGSSSTPASPKVDPLDELTAMNNAEEEQQNDSLSELDSLADDLNDDEAK